MMKFRSLKEKKEFAQLSGVLLKKHCGSIVDCHLDNFETEIKGFVCVFVDSKGNCNVTYVSENNEQKELFKLYSPFLPSNTDFVNKVQIIFKGEDDLGALQTVQNYYFPEAA